MNSILNILDQSTPLAGSAKLDDLDMRLSITLAG